MNHFFHHYRDFNNASSKEHRLIYMSEAPAEDADAKQRREDLQSAVDRMRGPGASPRPDYEKRGLKHRSRAERVRLYQETIPEKSDKKETERREKITAALIRHLYSVSFHLYLKKEKQDIKAIDATLKLITEKPEEFYYAEIGNTIVVKQRPDSTVPMTEAKLPVVFEKNTNTLIEIDDVKLDPQQWESWPVAKEIMEEFELARMQVAMPAIVRQYLNPAFTIYIEDELKQDWENSPVIKGLETIIANYNSDDLQYHMEGAKMIIVKRHTGGKPKTIPDDLYVAIDTNTGNVIQVGQQKLEPAKWDTWLVVQGRIRAINEKYMQKGEDLTTEELRYREAYLFRMPQRFGTMIKKKKELNQKEREAYGSPTYTAPKGLFDKLLGRFPGPRSNDPSEFGPSTRQLGIGTWGQPNILTIWIDNASAPAIAFTPEGNLLAPDESGVTYRPVADYHDAYQRRYHETREAPFRNPLMHALGEIKRKGIVDHPVTFATKLPAKIIAKAANINEATAKELAKKNAVDQLNRELQKILEINPPNPELSLRLPDSFFPAGTVTYDTSRGEASAQCNLDAGKKQDVLREFMAQNGLPLPEKPIEGMVRRLTAAYTVEITGTNFADATAKVKKEILKQLTAEVRSVVGGSSELLETDILVPLTVGVGAGGPSSAKIELKLSEDQRKKIIQKYKELEIGNGLTLIATEEEGATESDAKDVVPLSALVELSESIKETLETMGVRLGATTDALAESDLPANFLPPITVTPPAALGGQFKATIDLAKLTLEKRLQAIEAYCKKNGISLEAVAPEKPELSQRVSLMKLYGAYENPSELIQAIAILIEADGDEAPAKKEAQEKTIQYLTRKLCDKLGLNDTEFPYTLDDFKKAPSFDINAYTTYNTGPKRAFVEIKNPVPSDLRAAFVRGFLEHHGFKDKAPTTQILFETGVSFEDALAKIPDTARRVETVTGITYGTHETLVSIRKAGVATDIPIEEKTTFERIFNKFKNQFDPKADIRSPKNYPVWYRMIQQYEEEVKGMDPFAKRFDTGKYLAIRMIQPMNDLIIQDIRNKFRGTPLEIDSTFTAGFASLENSIRCEGKVIERNPETIVALAEGNLSDKPLDIQKEAEKIIESYFKEKAGEVIRLLATR